MATNSSALIFLYLHVDTLIYIEYCTFCMYVANFVIFFFCKFQADFPSLSADELFASCGMLYLCHPQQQILQCLNTVSFLSGEQHVLS